MNKIIVAVVVIFAILFSFGGSEIYKNDISNRLIIQGIGIDKEDDGGYTVTLQAINTSTYSASVQESGSEETVKIYKVHGDTVYTAIKGVVSFEGKIPLYSQNRVIVIGKATALGGIEGVIDFFARDAHNGPSVYVALAENRADEILEAKNSGEVIADSIDDTIEAAKYNTGIFKLELYELVNRYLDKDSCFAMPVLSLEEAEGQKNVQIKETALFCNAKLKSTLNGDETSMLNFLCGRVYNGEFSYKTDENEKVAMSIVNCNVYRTVKILDGTPHYTVKIKLSTDVAEIYNGIEKSLDRQRLEELSQYAENYLKTESEKVLSKLYEGEVCDAPGYSRLIFQKYPSVYRDNEENLNALMAKSRYSVEVEVKIRRVGHEFVKTL